MTKNHNKERIWTTNVFYKYRKPSVFVTMDIGGSEKKMRQIVITPAQEIAIRPVGDFLGTLSMNWKESGRMETVSKFWYM